MPLSITLAFGTPTPVYRQIVDQVCAAVVSGELQEGEALPSVRGLADELRLNQNTVARAYQQLSHEGIIGSQSTRGLFVLPRGKVYTKPERRRRMEPATQAFLGEAFLLGLTGEEIIEHVTEALDQLLANREGKGGSS